MKIRQKLTLQFTVLVGAILIFFAGTVYYLSALNRSEDFYNRVESYAFNTAKLLVQVPEIDSTLLTIIETNTINLLGEHKLLIFRPDGNLLFSTPGGLIPQQTINSILPQIREDETLHLKIGKKQFVGFVFSFNNMDCAVIASATDKNGFMSLRNLRFVLISGIIFTIAVTYLTGLYYSKNALSPINNVIKQVNSISASQLNIRVQAGNENDEISMLADTFNSMLGRLQEAFELQRSFVSNASHGIRTPLTLVSGQIEVSLFKTRTVEDYENLLKSILKDIRNLSNLSNSLLYLAQTSSDIEKIMVNKVRVDEVLLQTQTELEQLNKNYRISTDFEQMPEEENKLNILSNETILKIIFFNLMENACKYSADHKVNISIGFNEKDTIIKFSDNGRGINESDQKRMFEPFYRGTNTSDTKGHGIGLSLVKKILQLHNGSISIHSQLGTGTTISVFLPIA